MSNVIGVSPTWINEYLRRGRMKDTVIGGLLQHPDGMTNEEIYELMPTIDPKMVELGVYCLVSDGLVTKEGSTVKLVGSPFVYNETKDLAPTKEEVQALWDKVLDYRTIHKLSDPLDVFNFITDQLNNNPIEGLMKFDVEMVCQNYSGTPHRHHTFCYMFVLEDYTVVTHTIRYRGRVYDN